MTTPQFGEPHGTYTTRPSAYAVIRNDAGNVLVVLVRGKYHLPGGGIDVGEDVKTAVVREVREETGYEVVIAECIGNANQFFETSSLGPLNKTAMFFTATIAGGDISNSTEDDHQACWIPVTDFLESTASDFQKWAVTQTL